MAFDERRQYQRVSYSKKVYFGIDSMNYVAYCENISLGGLHLDSQAYMPAGTKLIVGFGNSKNDIEFKVKGKVKWIKSPDEIDQKEQLHHMGLDISWYDERYMLFLSDLIEKKRMTAEKKVQLRRHMRFDEKVTVYFDDAEEIVEQVTHNISRGGLFVCTEQPFKEGTNVSMRIVIPHIMEDVLVQGVVTFAINMAKAKKHNRPPGMGIKFKNFEQGDKDKFVGFLSKVAEKYIKK